MRIRSLQLSLMVALAAALAASPADAQGKGKGNKNRERTEQVRFREDDRRDDDRRRDDRWDDDDVRLERRRQVPPGWCRGKGNPHNTRENCGYDRRRDDRRYDDRRRDDRRYEDRRYEDRRYDTRSGSYPQAHQDFHRDHDRICRDRASQRPFDPRWQLQVRNECKVQHDRWHASTGTRH